MKTLAVDPSVNHLGWAVMFKDPATKNTEILSSGTIEAPTEYKGADLVERLAWMVSEVDDLGVASQDVDAIVIECPEPWGAYKSMASSRSGSLQMLTLLVGAITCWAIDMVGAKNTELIKVSQWKGQLPKHVTQRRMESKYHTRFKTDHEADAVGLGDYYLRSLNE